MQLIVLFRKLSKIGKPVLLLFFVFLTFFIVYYLDLNFKIKTIVIRKNISDIPVFGIDEFKNRYSFLINKKKAEESIKNKNPKVNTATVTISYPSTLYVELVFEKDFITIQTNNGYFIVDNKGKILEKTKIKKGRLPALTYFQHIDHSSYQPGNFIDYTDILTALYFIEKVQKLGVAVNTVDITSLYMIRLNLKDKTVIFSTEKSKEIQIYELTQILDRYRSNNNQYKIIDLRFNKPILKISE